MSLCMAVLRNPSDSGTAEQSLQHRCEACCPWLLLSDSGCLVSTSPINCPRHDFMALLLSQKRPWFHATAVDDELGHIEQAQARRASIEDEIKVDLPVSATSQRALVCLQVAEAASALLTCWRQALGTEARRAADCAHRASHALHMVLSAESCAAAAAATCALQALLVERSAMMRRCGYIQEQLSTLEDRRASVEQETRAREVGSLPAS